MSELYIFDTNKYSNSVGNKVDQAIFSFNQSKLTIFPVIDNKLLEIGRNSTFAGLYFSGTEISQNMASLIDQMLDWGSARSYKYRIKVPPQYLESRFYPSLEHIFLKKNAQIVIETNQHLAICGKDYSYHFSETNRKIVRRSISKGYSVTIKSDPNINGYNLLKNNREKRGAILSLLMKDLECQSRIMRDAYIFFECKNLDENLVAYAVCVKLKRDILYVLYWGEEGHERKNSPVVFLAKSIIDYCINNKILFLDAGKSSIDGTLDKGLFDFKSRLGFQSSFKYVIEGKYA